MRIDMNNETAIAEMRRFQADASLVTDLGKTFVRTDDFELFRATVFQVLEHREARLKAGVYEQKGVALIGPAGSGKSRIVEEVIREYTELTEATGGREFGTRIVSIVVPGRASVKDTCKTILKGLNYEIKGNRDEDTLWQRVMTQMKLNKVAALHLDEVQDSGRFKTGDSMALFAKRFRNMMQDRDWPVCLILSATPDAKEFINHDPTLTRRLKPIEMQDASVKSEGPLLREAILEMAAKLDLDDDGLTAEPEFIGCLIHAGANCFGLAMEIAIAALGEARSEGEGKLHLGHFANVYYSRTNSDDENNPFLSSHWKTIDTRKAMDRYIAQRQSRAKSA